MMRGMQRLVLARRYRVAPLAVVASIAGMGMAGCAAILDIEEVPLPLDAGDAQDASGDATTPGPDGGALDGQADATSGDAGDAGDTGGSGSDAAPPGAAFAYVGELLAADTGSFPSGFGSAIAFSPDGKWLAVGAIGDTANPGKVEVYGDADGGIGWTPRQSLQSVGGGSAFGSAVAFNSDGSSLAVGAPGSGEVDVFELIGGTVFNGGTALQGGSTTDRSGAAVAYAPADLLFVGAPGDSPTGGAVDSYMTPASLPMVSSQTGGELGDSLAIAGGVLLVGAPQRGAGGGAFVSPASAPASLTAVPGTSVAGDAEGTAVAVTPDGSYLLVGAPGASTVRVVYDSPGAGLAIEAASDLRPPSADPTAQFGASLAASRRAAAVGAYEAAGGGAVYIFPATGAVLPYSTASTALSPPGSSVGQFGKALAISADGSTLAVGAPDGQGHVYIYR